MGAWVETVNAIRAYQYPLSHPLWVRGLKKNIPVQEKEAVEVASFMGAWVETLESTSFVGLILSHPLWVRGLG